MYIYKSYPELVRSTVISIVNIIYMCQHTGAIKNIAWSVKCSIGLSSQRLVFTRDGFGVRDVRALMT